MAISFDQAFGVHEQAMKLRTQRAEVLARNLANADTPHYKAQDIDFKGVLQQVKAQQDSGMKLAKTDSRHIHSSSSGFTLDGINVELKYRQPLQPSMDGNTVETEQELARFAKNSGDFQASMTLLNSKIRGMMGALRGE